MEFFTWMIVPQIIVGARMGYASLEEYVNYRWTVQMIAVYVAAALYVLCLVLGGLGMMKMAKRAGLKQSWMGFVPFLNTYYAGRLAGETRVFGKKMKRAGLYAMIAEIVYVLLNVMTLVIFFAMTNINYYTLVTNGNYAYPAIDETLVPVSLRWMLTADVVCSILGLLAEVVLIFFLCVMFFAFFRKYYARSPFVMTFLCAVLPLRGFVIFAVRNNAPVDYDAWLRQRMQEYARQQQQMYGQWNNGGAGGGQSAPPEDPFPGYGDGGAQGGGADNTGGSGGAENSDDDPFPDF